MIKEIIIVCSFIALCLLAYQLYYKFVVRKNMAVSTEDLEPVYLKHEYMGDRVDVVMRKGDDEVIIKSYKYTDTLYSEDNHEFANVLADELIYYLQQDYTDQLNS